MPSVPTIEQLMRLCRQGRVDGAARRAEPSGFPALDAALPGGGWPLGAISELLAEAAGIGELRLVLPALARLSHADRYIACIAAPYLPYAPALAQHDMRLEQLLIVHAVRQQEALWAAEQALRCPAIGAVLVWSAGIDERLVRRLQLAAEAGGTLGLLYRPLEAGARPSPAALRLRLQAAAGSLQIEVQKCRGGPRGLRLSCPLQ